MRPSSLSGTVPDLYRHFGIDADSIARTIATEVPGRIKPFAATRPRLVS